jgi:hypothetical protein
MVDVKFVNRSAERVLIYQEDGSVLKILESGRCWDRNPNEGTLRTSVISQHETPPPPQPKPVWISKTEWLWKGCPDNSVYAPFKTITFLDGNKVQLKKRLFWKFQELDFPVTVFLFTSKKMKMIRERLDRDSSVLASIFLNGIPVRKSVSCSSKYSKYRYWYFVEQPVKKTSPKQMEATEIIQYGERIRNSTELKKLERMRLEEEEREKFKLV